MGFFNLPQYPFLKFDAHFGGSYGCFPRLLEIDRMCPFCIGHHVGIHPNTSISSIKMDIRKFSFSLGYPLDTQGLKMDLVTVVTVTKFFWSPSLGQLKNFGCQTYDYDRNYLLVG